MSHQASQSLQTTELTPAQVVAVVQACLEAKKRVPDVFPKQTFFGKYDMWFYLAIMDDKTCPTCMMLDQYPFQGADLRLIFPWLEVISPDQILPHGHPNCRCTMLRVTNLIDYITFTET